MMQPKSNSKRPRLKAVPTRPQPNTAECRHQRPEGAADGDSCCCYVQEPYHLITRMGFAPQSGELAVLETQDETAVGIYRPAPGGYVTLENDDEGEPQTRRFKPSDVMLVSRVMHIEMRGAVVARFPLAKGAHDE